MTAIHKFHGFELNSKFMNDHIHHIFNKSIVKPLISNPGDWVHCNHLLTRLQKPLPNTTRAGESGVHIFHCSCPLWDLGGSITKINNKLNSPYLKCSHGNERNYH